MTITVTTQAKLKSSSGVEELLGPGGTFEIYGDPKVIYEKGTGQVGFQVPVAWRGETWTILYSDLMGKTSFGAEVGKSVASRPKS